MTGHIVAGARGPLFKAEDGIVWRLLVGDLAIPEPSDALISIRGRIVAEDQLEVEFFGAADEA
jgi:hypothetical protein